jgi:hypothetical protein
MAGLVPAIPMQKGAALYTIEITGTRPVMTRESVIPGQRCKGCLPPLQNANNFRKH